MLENLDQKCRLNYLLFSLIIIPQQVWHFKIFLASKAKMQFKGVQYLCNWGVKLWVSGAAGSRRAHSNPIYHRGERGSANCNTHAHKHTAQLISFLYPFRALHSNWIFYYSSLLCVCFQRNVLSIRSQTSHRTHSILSVCESLGGFPRLRSLQ